MKTKVFISSTYRDLKNFRRQIWDDFTDENIELLGMEKFGAGTSAPLETCLVEIDKCDIYVGVIGYMYGSVEEKTLKSFTQLEYEKALELKREILIYLMHEEALTFPKFVDTGDSALRLQTFKKDLLKHTVYYFKEPDELSRRIYTDIKKLEPKFPLKFVRPRELKAKLTRFYIGKQFWLAFVGYLNGKPIEIWTGFDDEEMFPIPKSIEKGHIIQVRIDEAYRYDFVYIDMYGFENTLGGLSHQFHRDTVKYCNIITAMLRKKTDMSVVNDVIDNMDIEDFENATDWKTGVKKALNKK